MTMTEPVRKPFPCTVSQGDALLGKATVELVEPFMRRIKGRMRFVKGGTVRIRGKTPNPKPLEESFVCDTPITLKFQSGTKLHGAVMYLYLQKKAYEAEVLIASFTLAPSGQP